MLCTVATIIWAKMVIGVCLTFGSTNDGIRVLGPMTMAIIKHGSQCGKEKGYIQYIMDNNWVNNCEIFIVLDLIIVGVFIWRYVLESGWLLTPFNLWQMLGNIFIKKEGGYIMVERERWLLK